jgi:hypothetical protein
MHGNIERVSFYDAGTRMCVFVFYLFVGTVIIVAYSVLFDTLLYLFVPT